jgi:hypothetical protein
VTARKATKPKPKVAYANNEEAIRNIYTKLSLMTTVLRMDVKGITLHRQLDAQTVETMLPHLPRSIRQFNLWCIEDLPTDVQSYSPSFRRNSHATLCKLKTLFSAVDIAVNVASKADANNVGTTPKDNVARLHRSLSIANSLRTIVEVELIKVKTQCETLRGEAANLRLQLEELQKRVQK